MNIYFKELRSNALGLLIWSLAMVAYVNMAMVKFEATIASGNSMMELIQSMPKSLQNLMGVGLVDINTAIGFFTIAFIYLLLLGGIHGAMIGSTILSAEERDKTSEFLATRPVTRNRIMVMKFLAALTLVVIFTLVVFALSVVTVNRYGSVDYSLEVFSLMIGFFLTELFFLVLGFFLSAVLPSPKLAPVLTSGLLMLSFVLTLFLEMVEGVGFLAYFTPFSWFDGKIMLGLVAAQPLVYVVPLLLILLFLPLSFYFYNHRDLTI